MEAFEDQVEAELVLVSVVVPRLEDMRDGRRREVGVLVSAELPMIA